MLFRSKLKVGETAEIRCQLHRDGRYEETKYFIRYFQPDGAGTLKMSDGTVLLPNDLYPLPGETFRLYYTSASTDQQTVDVYFQDSFGQLVQLTFSLIMITVKKNRGNKNGNIGYTLCISCYFLGLHCI